ncbi:unnamed protein product [Oikopleura dioica]|uniref:Uncharacterized protein n=1 Tax=Oikopleura dioica TaxID=34765 RepID=E4X7N0_OIKDI|nr:unnamed protein product [Oikopleura dioica]
MKYRRISNPSRQMQTIKEILDTDDGINFSLLKAASKSGPLGKNWGDEEFLILGDILVDNAIFHEPDGPSTIITIVKRFIRERSDKAKFESIWFFDFLKDVLTGLGQFCINVTENEFVRHTKIVSDVLELWRLERNDGLRLELYRTVATLFEQFFIKKQLQLPQGLSEYIKVAMLFNLSDENIPDKPLAKKIVDMILRQNQSGPVQVNGYKLLQLIHLHSRQKSEIFANFNEFKTLLEKKPTLFEICHKLNSLQEFDTIEKVIIRNKEQSNVHVSFQRKLGMIMLLFEDSADYDYYPIHRHEISSAKIKQNDSHIVAQIMLNNNDDINQTKQEKIQLVFAKNTLFCGERIDDLFRKEGSLFFDFQTPKKRSNASSVRSVPISELKELRSVVDMEVIDEDGETQHTVDTSQPLSKQYSECRSARSSTYFRSEIVPLNAGRTPGPKSESMKAPSRKIRQSDSHSTLAPLTRGLETQFKLKQTPKNARKTKKDLNNMTITAGTPGIMMSAKKVKQEMHLPITPIETVRGKTKSDSADSDSVEIDAPSATIAMEKDHFSERSRKSNKSRSSKASRKTTPDMPVEFNSSPTELNMAPPRKKAKALSASTPVMQKVRPNVSETVTKEQQVLMQQLREKFATINKFMPRVQESINEIQSVKDQVDDSCMQHVKQMKETRKAVRKHCKETIRESAKKAADGEKKRQIANMAQQLMQRVVMELRK